MRNVVPLRPEFAVGDEPEIVVPPHSIEAEQAILGSALVNNAVLERCSWLVPEDFFEPVHGRIWQAMRDHLAAGRLADPVTLKPLFETDPSLLELEGVKYLARLAAAAETIFNAAEYAQFVKRQSRLRELRAVGEQIAAMAVAPDAEDAATIYGQFAKRIESLLVDETTPVAKTAAQVCVEIIREMENPRPFWRTGIAALDESLGGGVGGGYVIGFDARPKQFKSGTAHSVLLALARQRVTSAYFALEMGSARLGKRMLAHVGGFNSAMFKHVDAYTLERTVTAAREFGNLPLWFVDCPGMKFSRLKANANQLALRSGVRVFVLDYWQLVQPDQQTRNRAEFLADVAQWCADHAHEHGTTWIVCSQENRTGESYGSDGLAKACDWHAVLHKHEQPYHLGERKVETLWMDVKYARDSAGEPIGDANHPVLYIDPHGPHLAQLP